ncbi:ATP-binding protein [Streptomyces sp. NPDC001231]|uniref:ATP-binding protein n=1 Tax=Streptomyces sp. NPDC001231 TaxID=3364549 RepID=UPI00367C1746
MTTRPVHVTAARRLPGERELVLPGEPEMAGRARDFVRTAARDWELGEETADTAALVLSELVTNAVEHAKDGKIRIWVRAREDHLVVEVADHHPCKRLRARSPGPEEDHGRGLLIVQAVCLAWGRRRLDGDSVTWACLAISGEGAPDPHRGLDSLPPSSPPGDRPPTLDEGARVSLSPPGLNLYASWEALADGLQVQRLALHLPQLREQLITPPGDVALFARTSPGALTTCPAALAGPAAEAVIDGAGLAHWLRLPAEYGTADAGTTSLTVSAEQVADTLLQGVTEPVAHAAVAAVCAASAWWVGAFAVIRHLGVHHTSLQPVDTAVCLETLEDATRIVALGTAQRILAQYLRTADDETVRLGYCRAITESIVVESRLPTLLDELGELRLVDLVSTSIPWRGRFTKYAGGTGAGQVE